MVHPIKKLVKFTFLSKKTTDSWLKREAKGLISAIAIALLIRTFIYHPVYVPTGSMYPTIMVGDFFVVSKFAYGYSRYTFPFLVPPLPDGRLWGSKPKRGDVVVFNNPKDHGRDWIKRLVGLPGERIQMKAGILHINGEPVKLRRIDDYKLLMTDDRGKSLGQYKVLSQFIETLPNGVEHPILKDAPFGEGELDNTPEFLVPAGHYFMMGDNRDHSKDCRVINDVGFISATQLLGRAEMIFFSSEAKWYQIDQWLPGIRLQRFFSTIH